MTRLLILLLVFLVTPIALFAQADEDQESPFSSDPRLDTRLGMLLQQHFYYFADGAPGAQVGFRIPTARLRLHSFWDDTYELFVQVDFIRPISVMDAHVVIPFGDDIELVAGLFKSPFSRELLLFPEDLPHLERSRVVQALAPNRQIGASLRTYLLDDRLTLEAGVFNGNGAVLDMNNNDAFLVMGRLNWTTILPSGEVQIGLNAGYSEDTNVLLPFIGTSNGERILLGADVEVMLERWLLRGEGIVASFGDRSSIGTAYGYTGTLGYKVLDAHHLYVSYDAFDPESDLPEYGTFGYRIYLGEAVTLLANFRLPLDDPSESQAVLRLQFALR